MREGTLSVKTFSLTFMMTQYLLGDTKALADSCFFSLFLFSLGRDNLIDSGNERVGYESVKRSNEEK